MKKFNYLILILIIGLVGCSTAKNYKSIQVFEGKETKKIKSLEFTSIEVVKDIYPPANKVCVEFYQIEKNTKQCIEFLGWNEYVSRKYPNGELIKLDYIYADNIMILYIKLLKENNYE